MSDKFLSTLPLFSTSRHWYRSSDRFRKSERQQAINIIFLKKHLIQGNPRNFEQSVKNYLEKTLRINTFKYKTCESSSFEYFKNDYFMIPDHYFLHQLFSDSRREIPERKRFFSDILNLCQGEMHKFKNKHRDCILIHIIQTE